jgi:tetratricopeptide (TPR) repeat protein
MKKIKILALVLTTTISISAIAQIKAPQPSPTAEIEQMVGLTEIEIEYSRPGKKDREIFGKLVPYGEIWRTGANASTKFKTDKDITVNGKELKKGEYALYTIPGESEWTIIFHNNTSYWGVGDYKQDEDALRVTAKPTTINETIETFSIGFGHFTNSGAKMMLMWDKTIVLLDIETGTDKQMAEQIKAVLVDGPGAGDFAAGARYYMEKGENMEQALTWMNKAIEKRPTAFWYVHDKAQLLAKMGKKKEAIEAANKSIELAKANKDGDYGYVAKNEEFIKGLK